MPQDLLTYQPLVERFLKKTPADMAVFSFVNMFVWQDFFKFQFEEIDGNLCIFSSDGAGTFLYLPPLGKKISEAAVKGCFEKMAVLNQGTGVSRIENVTEGQLAHFPASQYKIYKKGYESLYYRQDLLGLKGQGLKPKRNAYNHFVKNYTGHYRPFEKAMIKECLGLYDQWAGHKKETSRGEIYLQMVEDNRRVHRRAMEFYDELRLVGRVVEVDGKIAGYTFGYFITKEIFCDLLEVADVSVKGLPTYIFHEFCNDECLKAVKFINVMDDFEMGNVSRTKLSFRPVLMVPAYGVSLKK